jgi:hypothetical protein
MQINGIAGSAAAAYGANLAAPAVERVADTAQGATGRADANQIRTGRSSSSARTGSRECRTCAERKYKDQSNDPSVSFQTATSVAPEQAAAAVMAHEQEHVSHNADRADRQGMQAHSTVTIDTSVCPECGRTYVSGGTTSTTYSRKASAVRDDTAIGALLDATA